MKVDPEDILQFWFADAAEAPAKAEARMPLWFDVSPETDARIRERFGTTVEAAARGEHASWAGAPRPALALVVLLDQFSRNIWRGTARAFAQDTQALAVARQAVAAGFLGELAPIEQVFLTLPFEHSESLAAQREAVRLCREITATAPPDWRPFLERLPAVRRTAPRAHRALWPVSTSQRRARPGVDAGRSGVPGAGRRDVRPGLAGDQSSSGDA